MPLSADKPWFHAGGPRDHSSTTSQQASSASSPGLPVALADANVLIPRTLRDYFVYAAKLGALQIHWSHPHELRDAHRLTVANSPKSEDEILTTLGKLVGVESARAVRLAVGIG